MAKLFKVFLATALVHFAVSNGRCYATEVHHVVGDDRGWDQSSDVGAWSAGKIFRAGDSIWFAYSAALESIAELRSKEELEACDLSSPLKVYTDGLDKVILDGEGHRYFTSNRPESCKNGLKLHVEVLPAMENKKQPTLPASEKLVTVAAEPSPSGSVRFTGVSSLIWFGSALLFLLFSLV